MLLISNTAAHAAHCARSADSHTIGALRGTLAVPRRRRAPCATRSTEAPRRSNSRARAPEANTHRTHKHTHKQTSRTFADIRAGTRPPLRWGLCGLTQCVGSATNAASLLCKILHTQSMHRWLRPVVGGAAVSDVAKAEASFAAPHDILQVSFASGGAAGAAAATVHAHAPAGVSALR